ncbi:unnamed protein product [Brassicogethes aeneus]|uniref:Uncharacterized protein n=1 Tax=Brassicogethes aeneus TaxID=1431903 RepID=A0A9P0B8Z6_BRAAE|nr:unnamed protein product [Brassicogethes aeneus]
MIRFAIVLFFCALSPTTRANETTFTEEIVNYMTEFSNENVLYLSKKVNDCINNKITEIKDINLDLKNVTHYLNEISEDSKDATYEFTESIEEAIEKLSYTSSLNDVTSQIDSATDQLDKNLQKRIRKNLKYITDLVIKCYGTDQYGLKKFKSVLTFVKVVLGNDVTLLSNSISISINNVRKSIIESLYQNTLTKQNLEDYICDIQTEIRKSVESIKTMFKREFMALKSLFIGLGVFTNPDKIFDTIVIYVKEQVNAIKLNLGYSLKSIMEEIIYDDNIDEDIDAQISTALQYTLTNSKATILKYLDEVEGVIKTNLTEPDQAAVNFILNGCYLIIASENSSNNLYQHKCCVKYAKIVTQVSFELCNEKVVGIIAKSNATISEVGLSSKMTKDKLVGIMDGLLIDVDYVEVWATDYLLKPIKSLEKTVYFKEEDNLQTISIITNLGKLITDFVNLEVKEADNIITAISNNLTSKPNCKEVNKSYTDIRKNIKILINQLEIDVYASLTTLEGSLNGNLININIKIRKAFENLNSPLTESFNASLQSFARDIIKLDGVGEKGYKRFTLIIKYAQTILENVIDVIIPAEFIKINQAQLKLLQHCRDGVTDQQLGDSLSNLKVDLKNASEKCMKLFTYQFKTVNVFIERLKKEYKDARNVITGNMDFVDRLANGEKDELVEDLSVYFYDVLDNCNNFNASSFLSQVKVITKSTSTTRSAMVKCVKKLLSKLGNSLDDVYSLIESSVEDIKNEYVKDSVEYILKSVATIVISSHGTTNTFNTTISVFFDLVTTGACLVDERLEYAYTNLEVSLTELEVENNLNKEELENLMKIYLNNLGDGFVWAAHYWKSGTGGLVNLTTTEFTKAQNYITFINDLATLWSEILSTTAEEINHKISKVFKKIKDTSITWPSISKLLKELKSKPLDYLSTLKLTLEHGFHHISDLHGDLNDIFPQIDKAFGNSTEKVVDMTKNYLKNLAREVVVVSSPGANGLKQFKQAVSYLLMVTKNIFNAVKISITTQVDRACYNLGELHLNGKLSKTTFEKELSLAKSTIKEILNISRSTINSQFGVLFNLIDVLINEYEDIRIMLNMSMEFITSWLSQIQIQYENRLTQIIVDDNTSITWVQSTLETIKTNIYTINQKEAILNSFSIMLETVHASLDNIDDKIKKATKGIDENKKEATKVLLKSFYTYIKAMDLTDQTSADVYKKIIKNFQPVVETAYLTLEENVNATIMQTSCELTNSIIKHETNIRKVLNNLEVNINNDIGKVYNYIIGPCWDIADLVTTKPTNKPSTKTIMETINYELTREYYNTLNKDYNKIIDEGSKEITNNITFLEAVIIIRKTQKSCLKKVNKFDDFLDYKVQNLLNNLDGTLNDISEEIEEYLEDTETVLTVLVQERFIYLSKVAVQLEGVGFEATKTFKDIVLYTQKFMRYHNTLMKMTIDQIFDGVFATLTQMNSKGELTEENVKKTLNHVKTFMYGAVQTLINKFDVQSQTIVDMLGIFIGEFKNPENLTKTLSHFYELLFNRITKAILGSTKVTIKRIEDKGVDTNTNIDLWFTETSLALNASLIKSFVNLEIPADSAINAYSNSLLLSIYSTNKHIETSISNLSETNKAPIQWLLKTLTALCRAQVGPGNQGTHLLRNLLYWYNKSLYSMYDLVLNKWQYTVMSIKNELLELIVENKLTNDTLKSSLSKIYEEIDYQTDWSLSFAYDHFNSIVIEENRPMKIIYPGSIVEPMHGLSHSLIENITTNIHNRLDVAILEIGTCDNNFANIKKLFEDLKHKNGASVVNLLTIFNTKFDNLRLSIKGTLNNIYTDINDIFGDFEPVVVKYKKSLTILADAVINIDGTNEVLTFVNGWTSINAIVNNIVYSLKENFDSKINNAISKSGSLIDKKKLTNEKLVEILEDLKQHDSFTKVIDEELNDLQRIMDITSLELPESRMVIKNILGFNSKYLRDITVQISKSIFKIIKDYEKKNNNSADTTFVKEVENKLRKAMLQNLDYVKCLTLTTITNISDNLETSLEGIDEEILIKTKELDHTTKSVQEILIDLSSIISSSSKTRYDFLKFYKKALNSVYMDVKVTCFIYSLKLKSVISKFSTELTEIILKNEFNSDSFSKLLQKIPGEVYYAKDWTESYEENGEQTIGEVSTVEEEKYFKPSDIIDDMPSASKSVVMFLVKRAKKIMEELIGKMNTTQEFDGTVLKSVNETLEEITKLNMDFKNKISETLLNVVKEFGGNLNFYYDKIPRGLQFLDADLKPSLSLILNHLATRSIKIASPYSDGFNLFTKGVQVYGFVLSNTIDDVELAEQATLKESLINIEQMVCNDNLTKDSLMGELFSAKSKVKMLCCNLTKMIKLEIAALDLFIHIVVYDSPNPRIFGDILMEYYRGLIIGERLIIIKSVNTTIENIKSSKNIDSLRIQLNTAIIVTLNNQSTEILETLATFKNNLGETLDYIDYSPFSTLEKSIEKTITDTIKLSVVLIKATKGKYYYGVNTLKLTIDTIIFETKGVLNIFSTCLNNAILETTSSIEELSVYKKFDDSALDEVLDRILPMITRHSKWVLRYGESLIGEIINITTKPIQKIYPSEFFEYSYVIGKFLSKFNVDINAKVEKIIEDFDKNCTSSDVEFSTVKSVMEYINTTCGGKIEDVLDETRNTLEEIDGELNNTLINAEEILYKALLEVNEPTKTYLGEYVSFGLTLVVKNKGVGSNAVEFFKLEMHYIRRVLEFSFFLIKNIIVATVDNSYYNIGLKMNSTTISKSVLLRDLQVLQIIIKVSLEAYKNSAVSLVNSHKYSYSMLPDEIFYAELHVNNFVEFSKPLFNIISQSISSKVSDINDNIDDQQLDKQFFGLLSQDVNMAIEQQLSNIFKRTLYVTNKLKNNLGITLDDVDSKIDSAIKTIEPNAKALAKKEYTSYSNFVIQRKGAKSLGVTTLKTGLFLMTQRMTQFFGIFERQLVADANNIMAALTAHMVNNEINKNEVQDALNDLSKNVFMDGNVTQFYMGNMFVDMREVFLHKDKPSADEPKIHSEL